VPQEPSQSGGKEETISRLHTTILESFGSSRKFSSGYFDCIDPEEN
jgi:hypothetical protein